MCLVRIFDLSLHNNGDYILVLDPTTHMVINSIKVKQVSSFLVMVAPLMGSLDVVADPANVTVGGP